MTAPAETHEGGGGVVELWFAGTRPPFTPFALKSVDIVARRGGASFFVGFVRQGRQVLAIGGQGAFDPFVIAVEKNHHIRFFIEDQSIVGQVIVERDFFHMLAKALDRTL